MGDTQMAKMKPCPHCGGSGMLPETFGDRVKERREILSMTQAQLSEKVGISRPQIANLESGRGDASVALLIGLSGELGVTIDWLLKGSTEP